MWRRLFIDWIGQTDEKGLSEMNTEWPWYAIRVRSRCEKVVAASLHAKGYPCYLPIRTKRQSTRQFELPLFPGYVFSRFDPLHRVPIIKIPGFVSIVSDARGPLPINEEEIAAVRHVEAEIAN